MAEPWTEITASVAEHCAGVGLDLVQLLRVRRYNEAVQTAYRLPDFGRPDALAVLIGNTRALWPRFLAALRVDSQLRAAADPLDRYTERYVRAAAASLTPRSEARFAHEPPPRRVAMQRLAQVAGLAYLSPSFLCVHPTYGPWIGLRAVVVVDCDGPPGPPPLVSDPCADCRTRCRPLLEQARAAAVPGRTAIGGNWRPWLTVRDACPVGRAHRYADDQIEYHYTWDPVVLGRALATEE